MDTYAGIVSSGHDYGLCEMWWWMGINVLPVNVVDVKLFLVLWFGEAVVEFAPWSLGSFRQAGCTRVLPLPRLCLGALSSLLYATTSGTTTPIEKR